MASASAATGETAAANVPAIEIGESDTESTAESPQKRPPATPRRLQLTTNHGGEEDIQVKTLHQIRQERLQGTLEPEKVSSSGQEALDRDSERLQEQELLHRILGQPEVYPVLRVESDDLRDKLLRRKRRFDPDDNGCSDVKQARMTEVKQGEKLTSERRVRIKRPVFGVISPIKFPPSNEAPLRQQHVSSVADRIEHIRDQETAVSSSTPDAEPEAPKALDNLEDYLELEAMEPDDLDESCLKKTTTDLMNELEDMLQ